MIFLFFLGKKKEKKDNRKMKFDYSFINLSVLVKIEKIANYLVKLHYLNYVLVCFFKNLLINLNHDPLYFFTPQAGTLYYLILSCQ